MIPIFYEAKIEFNLSKDNIIVGNPWVTALTF
jgi:hypothetical protein